MIIETHYTIELRRVLSRIIFALMVMSYLQRIEKVALSYNDDKVFICDDNVNTFNHGHFRSRF